MIPPTTAPRPTVRSTPPGVVSSRGTGCDARRSWGQIRPEVDVQVLVDQLWGAVYHRLLIPDKPVTDDFVVALVTNLMDGIAGR
ncbi:MAG: TetR-like C-terminal domain-containing protein [Sciscionella sp.]